MNKIEVWKQYELFELFNDLDAAQKTLAEYQDGYSRNSISAEEFYTAFQEELDILKKDNVPDFRQICLWFAPDSAWEDFVGSNEKELVNRILERANRWNKEQL